MYLNLYSIIIMKHIDLTKVQALVKNFLLEGNAAKKGILIRSCEN